MESYVEFKPRVVTNFDFKIQYGSLTYKTLGQSE